MGAPRFFAQTTFIPHSSAGTIIDIVTFVHSSNSSINSKNIRLPTIVLFAKICGAPYNFRPFSRFHYSHQECKFCKKCKDGKFHQSYRPCQCTDQLKVSRCWSDSTPMKGERKTMVVLTK